MNNCLLAIASLRGFLASYAAPITLLVYIVFIPAVVALGVLSYVLKQAAAAEEEEEANDDGNSSYTMMSTREWLAQRYVPCALEAAIVDSIPLVKFVHAAANEPAAAASSSCVVCLTPFQEDEELKVLPSCQHAFHPLCIDPWFKTHSTCPVCRSEVTPIDIWDTPPAFAGGNGDVFASCHNLAHVPLIEIVVN